MFKLTDTQYQILVKKFKKKFPDDEMLRSIYLEGLVNPRLLTWTALQNFNYAANEEYFSEYKYSKFLYDFVQTKDIITHFDETVTLEQLAVKINELEIKLTNVKK